MIRELCVRKTEIRGANTMLPRLHLAGCSSCDDNRGDAGRGTATRPWRRVITTALSAAMLLGGFSGCTTIHNGYEALTNNGAWNDTMIVLRNRSFSAKAWHRRKHNFCREKYINDFCAGFRSGFEDVAGGSDGCTPAFPPKEYWSWEFQSAEGQARTAAWMAGYPHGARAAEEDGAANWTQLQMSTGLQAQYQQTGTFEHQGALYPIPGNGDQSHSMGQPYVITDQAPTTEAIPPVPLETVPNNIVIEDLVDPPR